MDALNEETRQEMDGPCRHEFQHLRAEDRDELGFVERGRNRKVDVFYCSLCLALRRVPRDPSVPMVEPSAYRKMSEVED